MARKSIEEVLANDSATVGAMFGASKGEQAPEMRMIPWEKIQAHAANFYSVDDVEDLVNSIKMHGLLDPVVVTPQDDGSWLLISGHRRHKAWGVLREEDPVLFAEIPAIVRHGLSGPMAELALIMANSSARRLSAPEISQQAQRVEELLYELKEQGYSFPGRMRDQVAKACDVSATKLARLKVIRDKLSESWAPLWADNKIPEATAYELAQGSPEIQEKIFRASGGKTPNSHLTASVRDMMRDGTTYDGTQVKNPGCDKCTHGDAFLRHDLTSYSKCCGTTCCLKCRHNDDYNSCERACSKAKKVKSEKNAKEKAKQEAKEKAAKAKLRQEICESAKRLLKAAEAAGLGNDELIPCGSYWGSKSILWVRAAADPDGDIGNFYANPLAPERLDVPETAKLLRCSTDYLYRLTDELQPAGGSFGWVEPREYDPPIVEAEQVISEVVSESDTGEDGFSATLATPISAQALATIGLVNWMTGEPAFSGRYLCTVVTEDGIALEQTCDRVEGEWRCYGQPLAGMFTVQSWWPLPPKFERWMLKDEITEEEANDADS